MNKEEQRGERRLVIGMVVLGHKEERRLVIGTVVLGHKEESGWSSGRWLGKHSPQHSQLWALGLVK